MCLPFVPPFIGLWHERQIGRFCCSTIRLACAALTQYSAIVRSMASALVSSQTMYLQLLQSFSLSLTARSTSGLLQRRHGVTPLHRLHHPVLSLSESTN